MGREGGSLASVKVPALEIEKLRLKLLVLLNLASTDLLCLLQLFQMESGVFSLHFNPRVVPKWVSQ